MASAYLYGHVLEVLDRRGEADDRKAYVRITTDNMTLFTNERIGYDTVDFRGPQRAHEADRYARRTGGIRLLDRGEGRPARVRFYHDDARHQKHLSR